MADTHSPLRGAISYLSPYKWSVFFGCVMLLATSALSLTIPYYLGKIIDALRGPAPRAAVLPLALLMGVMAVLQALTRIASRVTLFNAARAAEFDVRGKLFEHLLSMDRAFMSKRGSGDLMSRLTNDVSTLRALWGPGVLNVANTTIILSATLVVMLRIDWKLAFLALLPYPAIVLLGSLFGKRIYKASRAVQEELGGVSSQVQEDLSGIGVIRTYGLEAVRNKRFAKSSTSLREKNMRLALIRGALGPLLGGVASLGTVAVLWAGGYAVAEGRITLGQLVQFNAYLAALVWPTIAFGWMLSLVQRGMASYQRIDEILSTKPEIVDGKSDAKISKGKIEIRNLSLPLDGENRLKNISVTIEPGKTVALVGRTGAGKSVLIDSMVRLHNIPKGTVFIDDVDITDLPVSTLRHAIGYAPQDAFLFSRSLSENIEMGTERGNSSSEPSSSPDEVFAAAQAAGLDRDLEVLPNGLSTMVGERGITLSGGQRQRVALARALATKPTILLLDDSLSSVDADTEKRILANLETVMEGRTSILVSHRVAAVTMADEILVLDNGTLVERGRHEDLILQDGVYTEVYRTQIETGDGL